MIANSALKCKHVKYFVTVRDKLVKGDPISKALTIKTLLIGNRKEYLITIFQI